MIKLIKLLDEGGYSCVIANGEEVRTFSQRGIADLYQLFNDKSNPLSGAVIADKVVGKGAAALMVAGGVKQLYSHIISEGALQILDSSAVVVEYKQRVPHIINRDGSGWCPVETLCKGVVSIEKIVTIIDKFIADNKK